MKNLKMDFAYLESMVLEDTELLVVSGGKSGLICGDGCGLGCGNACGLGCYGCDDSSIKKPNNERP